MAEKRILLVDDDTSLLNQMMEMLSSDREYLYYRTTSGKQACEIAQKKQPDLIITDWQMPGMSGLDIVNNIKSNHTTKEIPIIVVTGVKTTSVNLKAALDTGAVDFIRKPIDPIELTARVRSILQLSHYHKEIVRQKERELALHAMYMLKSNEADLKLAKRVAKLAPFITDEKSEMIEVIEEIMDSVKSKGADRSWSDFEAYFTNTHPDFTSNILNYCPELTPSELKLCVFFRMNMSSKEVASVLSIQPESVKTARKRLRKKLNLEPSDSLLSLLSSF